MEMAMERYKDWLVGGRMYRWVEEMPILENMAFRRLAGFTVICS